MKKPRKRRRVAPATAPAPKPPKPAGWWQAFSPDRLIGHAMYAGLRCVLDAVAHYLKHH